MNRNIPNKPHPTPNPDKHHSSASSDRGNLPKPVASAQTSAGQNAPAEDDNVRDEPHHDSSDDDLDEVLSQSIQQPDPDPNLESSASTQDAAGSPAGNPSPRHGKPPRTSEIFRSVVSPTGNTAAPPVQPESSIPQLATTPVPAVPDFGLVERRPQAENGSADDDSHQADANIPWGQILLLSYSSAITLGLIWMFWTGRFPNARPSAPAGSDKPALEAPAPAPVESVPSESPALPAENITSIGKSLRIGELEVTPTSIIAAPLELVRTIDPDRRRRTESCLILRLKFTNHSTDKTFAPLDRVLVRERELRPFDPYIATSDGQHIRYFPLAFDSEWSIRGQTFPLLEPGESGETFIAAEPGSADQIAGELTWRVRLRIGVYRSDMIGVRFTKDEVERRRAMISRDDESGL